MKNTLKIFFLLTIFFSLQVISQSKEGLKIQAEQQLQTMSPEEIDAAIKNMVSLAKKQTQKQNLWELI